MMGAGISRTTRIAHLTDIHFGATDAAVVAGLIADLAAWRPDLVVVSGDLTMGARRWEFRAARAFMDSLGAPVLSVPGNHDITPYRPIERFFMPFARWHQEIAAETEPVWQDGRVGVVGLNTAHRMTPHLDWSRGRVTHRGLARLLGKLEALPAGLTKIVVAHHPLLPPEGEFTKQIADGAKRALAALAAHGVRLVLSGHLHRAYARLTEPVILQGGSATSVRLRGEPNEYNLISVDDSGEVNVQGRQWNKGAWAEGRRRLLLPAGLGTQAVLF